MIHQTEATKTTNKRKEIEIGSYVEIEGNWGAWETATVEAIQDGKAWVNFGSDHFPRYGTPGNNWIPLEKLSLKDDGIPPLSFFF